MEKIIWTKSRARLRLIKQNQKKNYNWVFVPGGPGLGSESLNELIEILNLPGKMWLFDFPGDGSNTKSKSNFSQWQPALIEATELLSNVILVAHSSGGMFALATLELEKNLMGLVLMDSAPNKDWQKYFSAYVQKHPIKQVTVVQRKFQKKPSNHTLKEFTMASVPYFAHKKNFKKMIHLLDGLPFNYKSYAWSEKYFDSSYMAKWVPRYIPTLIIAGDQDVITPLALFKKVKRFKRGNVKMIEIKNAAHFPWLDNPKQIKKIFTDYCRSLSIKNI